jgi:hypothetical protein
LSIFGLTPDLAQIIPQDGDFSVESHWGYPLKDDDSGSLLIDVEQSVDFFLEGVQFAGSVDQGPFRIWVIVVLGHGFTTEMEQFCDFSNGKPFVGQAMDFEDGALVNHGLLLWISG